MFCDKNFYPQVPIRDVPLHNINIAYIVIINYNYIMLKTLGLTIAT